jgi:hypothetical protein
MTETLIIVDLQPLKRLILENKLNALTPGLPLAITDMPLAELKADKDSLSAAAMAYLEARQVPKIETGIPAISTDLRALGVDPLVESIRRVIDRFEGAGKGKYALLVRDSYQFMRAPEPEAKTRALTLTQFLRKATGGPRLEKVMFTNKFTAERSPGWPDWAVISITEPEQFPGEAKIQDGWHSICRVNFHDVDLATKTDEPYVLMTERDTQVIVDFVHSAAPEVYGILVHCKAGVSRSAAVAKWIARAYGLPFDHGYKQYNKYVYELVWKAGTRKGHHRHTTVINCQGWREQQKESDDQ